MNEARIVGTTIMSSEECDDVYPRPPCGIVGTSPDKHKLGATTSSGGGGMDCTEAKPSPHHHLNFNLSNWSPDVPPGLGLGGLGLPYHHHHQQLQQPQPLGLGPSGSSGAAQAHSPAVDNGEALHDFVGKIRRPKSRLRCRRGAVVLSKNPLGKDIKEERKLRSSASKGDVQEVRRLLDDGANPNRADDKGRAALHFAVTKGNQEMVQVLLDKGANVNQKDGIGNTPLHLAVFSSHMGVVTTLLENGASPHDLDRDGHTPVRLARSRLRHIKDSSCKITSAQLQNEVLQLVAMLKVYMNSIGLSEHMNCLDQLSLQVQENTTNEQVDAIEDVLNNFTSLSLHKP